jgi:predicted DNA-binding transcriptional regulator AlpA
MDFIDQLKEHDLKQRQRINNALQLLSVKDIADLLSISKRHAYDICKNLTKIKIGKSVRYRATELYDFISKNQQS